MQSKNSWTYLEYLIPIHLPCSWIVRGVVCRLYIHVAEDILYLQSVTLNVDSFIVVWILFHWNADVSGNSPAFVVWDTIGFWGLQYGLLSGDGGFRAILGEEVFSAQLEVRSDCRWWCEKDFYGSTFVHSCGSTSRAYQGFTTNCILNLSLI